MKFICFLILSLNTVFHSFAQESFESDFINKDLKFFIDRIYQSKKIDTKNKIYVLTCECVDTIEKKKKLEVTFIENQDEFKQSIITYYIKYKDDFVITHDSSLNECPELKSLNFDQFRNQSDIEYQVVQELYPNVLGRIWSEKWRLIVYFDKNHYRSILYESSKRNGIVIQDITTN